MRECPVRISSHSSLFPQYTLILLKTYGWAVLLWTKCVRKCNYILKSWTPTIAGGNFHLAHIEMDLNVEKPFFLFLLCVRNHPHPSG